MDLFERSSVVPWHHRRFLGPKGQQVKMRGQDILTAFSGAYDRMAVLFFKVRKGSDERI